MNITNLFSDAYKFVRKLQIRITKAVQVNKQGRVSDALSIAEVKTLLHSHKFNLCKNTFHTSTSSVTIWKVINNKGGKTAGVDKVVWTLETDLFKVAKTLKRKGYKPLPLRRIYIPKRNGKLRPLGIPTMKDRAMQALYLLALEPIAETLGDPNSYGFRKHRSCRDAIAYIFRCLILKGSATWIYEADIKGCFDNTSTIAQYIASITIGYWKISQWTNKSCVNG